MSDSFYRRLKEKLKSDFQRGKTMKETDSRILIDKQLRQAGWDIEDKNQVTTEEQTKNGRADYVLLDVQLHDIVVH